LQFNAVKVGTTAKMVIKLKNEGPLTYGAIHVVNKAGTAFSKGVDKCEHQSFGFEDECLPTKLGISEGVEVLFTPTVSKKIYEAWLEVEYAEPFGPDMIAQEADVIHGEGQ
jgi:hypothetical protein